MESLKNCREIEMDGLSSLVPVPVPVKMGSDKKAIIGSVSEPEPRHFGRLRLHLG